MQKIQLVESFRHIYAALPKILQRSFWKVMFFAIVAAITELVLSGAVSLLGVVLASPQTIVQSTTMHKLTQSMPFLKNIVDDNCLLLALLLTILCGTVLLKTLMLVFLTLCQSHFSQTVSMNFGIRLYKGFMEAPYLWHTRQKISNLMTLLGWRSTIGIFLFSSLQALSQIIISIILLSAICLMAPLASIMILVVIGGSACLIFRFSRKWIQKFSQQCAAAQQTSTKMIHTGLNGIREVMIYQQQSTFIQQYTEAEQLYTRGQSILPVFPPLPSWVLEFIGMLLLLGTVLLLRWQNASLAHTSATLALLAAVAWRLLPIMNRVLQNMISMQQQLPMINPVLKMLQEVDKFSLQQEKTKNCPLQQELILQDVGFYYPNTEALHQKALDQINLRIPKGRMVGLIGPSGAGKSTIVGLLTGLYAPTEGSILIDGRPLQEENLAGWMQSIGYVPQSPFLLNASILENVTFSQWGSIPDREHALRCCRMAAMAFLDELPDGIDTIIGERGVRLSGGQIQRVSIARALYGNPQILLFDEATSALDGASEQAIQRTINDLSGQMTIVVVAHRLTTVERCDYLYWIDEGTIRMEGSPAEVLPAYTRYLQKEAPILQAS